MLARSRTHPYFEVELFKWFALVILAGAIALLLAGPLGGFAAF